MKRKYQKRYYKYNYLYIHYLYTKSFHLTDDQNAAKSPVRDTLNNACHTFDQLRTHLILDNTFVNKFKIRIRQTEKFSFNNIEEILLLNI